MSSELTMSKPRRGNVGLDASGKVIRTIGYLFLALFSLACLVPFLIILATSFSSEHAVTKYGFGILPRDPSVFAYHMIFAHPDQLLGSYVVTVLLTVVGTSVGLFLTAMTGYALQRPDFTRRNKVSFYIYFTTLFSGGLVPFYLLMTRYLGLKNNYLAILLPSLLSAWNIIMMKNFMKDIPHAVTESALIDGAGDFRIFCKIILPMATPALATIGLFIALGYWNEWYNSMLFLDTNVKYRPLQLLLYNMISEADFIKNSPGMSNIPARNIPTETLKMATAIVAIGPVILFFPFVQKYFIAGIKIGAVKG